MRLYTSIGILVALTLSACEERQNPLASLDESTLVDWLLERDDDVVQRLRTCAEFWSETTGVGIAPDGRADCNEVAEYLAVEMTAAGFGNVVVTDVYLPTVWTEFHSRRANAYEPGTFSFPEGVIR